MKFAIFILSALLSVSVCANEVPCWMDPETLPKTSQLAVLKTSLLPINLDEPKKDLKARVSHQDYRFIAIGGFSVSYPGLNDKNLLCVHGGRFILGTSDALESKEHGELIGAFRSYAKEYNIALERLLAKE